jgi:hypothetical protein
MILRSLLDDGSFAVPVRRDTLPSAPAPKTLPCPPPEGCADVAALTPGCYYVGDLGQVSQLIGLSTRSWRGGNYEVAVSVSGHWGERITSEQRSDVWAASHRSATDAEVASATAAWADSAARATKYIDTSREGT